MKQLIVALLLLVNGATAGFANPPGGSYIQCDPHNPQSPIRCKADDW